MPGDGAWPRDTSPSPAARRGLAPEPAQRKPSMLRILPALLALPLAALGAELTLADSLRLALERHPDVLASEASVRIRLAEALAAEQRSAPRLEVEAKDLGGEGGAEVRLLQPIRRGDLGLRDRYAAAERASARADGQARLLGALNDTFRSHVALWSSQAQLALARERDVECAELLRRARESADAGLLAPADVAALEAQSQEARAAVAVAEAARLEAAAAHGRRIGATAPPVVAAPALAPLPSDPAPLVEFALRRSDLRAAVAAREDAARRRRAVERAESDHPVEVGLIAEQRADGASWAVGVGFSLDLPVPGRRRAAAELADAELRAARAHPLLGAPDAVASEVRSRLAAAQAAAAAADAHAAALLARRRSAEDSARALAEGLRDLSAHAEALARLDEARRRDLELRLEALLARSRLEESLGGRLEQILP